MSRSCRELKDWCLSVLFVSLASLGSVAHAAQAMPLQLPLSFISPKSFAFDRAQQQWLAQRGPLRVGVYVGDYAPLDITGERKNYQGISADYLGLVRDTLGVNVSVSGFRKRDQAVAALLSGKIDLLTSAGGYERGVEGLIFSADYMADRSVVVERGSDVSHKENWDRKKIGFLEGHVDSLVAHAFYPKSHIIFMPDLSSALEALAEGEVDALIGNEVVVRSFKTLRPNSGLRIVGESNLPASGFAFATRREDVQLLSLIDRVLSNLDTGLTQVIHARWTTGLGGGIGHKQIELSSRERDWIRQNPVVTVASQQYPLYTFKTGDERWVGLSQDILFRISRMTGLEFVHRESLSTAHTLELLQSGQAHMNTTLTESVERKAFLNFTYSFGGAPWVFVVRINDSRLGSLSQLAGQVLVLPARHALVPMIRSEHPHIKLKLVENYAQARHLVERGDALATIQNETQAYLYPPGRLKVGRSVEGRWSADSFAVSARHPELRDILNKGLEALPMAEVRALRVKWLGGVGIAPVIASGDEASPWVFWLSVVGIALSLICAFWYWHLIKQLRIIRLAFDRLQERQASQQRYFDAVPNPIFIRGLRGEIIACNRAYSECFATPDELMNGQRITEVDMYTTEVGEHFHAELMHVLESRKPLYEKRRITFKKHSVEIYRWIVPVYSESGQLEGAMGGWFDISGHKAWE